MKNIVFSLIAVFTITSTVIAQEDTVDTYNESVTVVGAYDPTLMVFPKINEKPVVNDTSELKRDLEYTIFPQPLKTSYETKPFSAAKMSGEPFKELYGNYIRLGGGMNKTIFGDLYLNTKRDKEKSVGLHLKHLSSSGSITDYAFTGNSNNLAELYYSRFRKRSSIHLNAFFDRETIHYYGFNPNELITPIDKDDYKQRYNYSGLNFVWQSAHTDSSHTNYRLNMKYGAFWDLDESLDHNIFMNGFLHKNVRWLSISKYQGIGVKMENEYVLSHRSFNDYSAGALNIRPYVNTNLGLIFIELGANLAMDIDTNSEAKIYPHIQMDLNLLPGTITAFGGVDGNVTYDSYLRLSRENPFIHYQVENTHAFTDRELYGGIRGNLGKRFSYSITGRQKKISNYALFVNDTLTNLGHWYGVVRDEINMFTASFDALMKIKEKWSTRLSFSYNDVDAVNEKYAWHIPNYEGTLTIGYNLADKFIVRTSLFVVGSRWARQYTGSEFIALKLDPIFDGNLSFEYRYSKVLSGFLQFNNIAAQKYMLWNQYPAYRFQVLGGVTYAF
ncbi:MAG: hypothetical protein C0592_06005 [Marinilabiliales bacterium]|nr:MAG: hypothetical protein C0592_06005 [Marinilabiliales bacterium]